MEDKNTSLLLQRIYYNPTIDIDIEVDLFRQDLVELADGSNQTLDITPLKQFDNGRWYLILSNILNNPTEIK